jgi:hypothetical protein
VCVVEMPCFSRIRVRGLVVPSQNGRDTWPTVLGRAGALASDVVGVGVVAGVGVADGVAGV